MKLKNTVSTVGFLSALILAPGVMANSIVLNQDAYSYKVGGEFNAVTSPDNFLGNYVPATIVNNGFETFCIETTVTFAPGASYNYNLSDTDSLGRALTQGAAFLYYEFAKGILPGYDYASAVNRNDDAGELQAAIWWLQDNQTYSGYPTGGAGNPFYDLAASTLGSDLTVANSGKYAVQVLQLWDQQGHAHQNQLVCVPDGGATWGMLAIGVAGLFVAGLRRRRPSSTT